MIEQLRGVQGRWGPLSAEDVEALAEDDPRKVVATKKSIKALT